MRYNLGIFTVARSDYGILKKVIYQFGLKKKCKTTLYVGSAHKSKIFGETKREIEKVNVNKKFFKNDYISSTAKTTINYFSEAVQETERLISKDNLDAVVIMGDRYEMLAISFVCLNYNIPIIHLCGGSITEGSLDDYYRYSISKMASLHLVETKIHKENLLNSGIKKNIRVVGAPALENIDKRKYFNLRNNSLRSNKSQENSIVCCFHPETNLGIKNNLKHLKILIKFLKSLNKNCFFSYPNADSGYMDYINLIHSELKNNKKIKIVKSFGVEKYYEILSKSKLMIGNSSSGIIESASFGLPCINLGNRQKGRFSPKNVLHSKFDLREIYANYQKATNMKFIHKIKKYKNPYFKPNTSKLIVKYIVEFLKITT